MVLLPLAFIFVCACLLTLSIYLSGRSDTLDVQLAERHSTNYSVVIMGKIRRFGSSRNTLRIRTRTGDVDYTVTHLTPAAWLPRGRARVSAAISVLFGTGRDTFALKGDRPTEEASGEESYYPQNLAQRPYRNHIVFPREVGTRLLSGETLREVEEAARQVACPVDDGGDRDELEDNREYDINLGTYEKTGPRGRKWFLEFVLRVSNWHRVNNKKHPADVNGETELTVQFLCFTAPETEAELQQETARRRPEGIVTTTPADLTELLAARELREFIGTHQLRRTPVTTVGSADDE